MLQDGRRWEQYCIPNTWKCCWYLVERTDVIQILLISCTYVYIAHMYTQHICIHSTYVYTTHMYTQHICTLSTYPGLLCPTMTINSHLTVLLPHCTSVQSCHNSGTYHTVRHSILISIRVLWYQLSCHNCFHFATSLNFWPPKTILSEANWRRSLGNAFVWSVSNRRYGFKWAICSRVLNISKSEY